MELLGAAPCAVRPSGRPEELHRGLESHLGQLFQTSQRRRPGDGSNGQQLEELMSRRLSGGVHVVRGLCSSIRLAPFALSRCTRVTLQKESMTCICEQLLASTLKLSGPFRSF